MKKTSFWVFIIVATFAFCPAVLDAGKGGKGDRPPEQRQGRVDNVVVGPAVTVFSGASQSRSLPELSSQSTKNDGTALRVQNGANVTVGSLTVHKQGDASSEEASNFYSLDAAVAVWEKSSLVVNGGRVTTSGNGANAFVAYGTNAVLRVSDVEIFTSKHSSRGLFATYGGTIEGRNLKVTTKGAHCAALATDRGRGTVMGWNIWAQTSGDGSPGIYSTGNISAIDSFFEAFDAEAAVIEGKNSILVRNCNMIGHRRCGAMLYQSFSGDAETGTCVFTMEGGSLTGQVGPVFYVTNTNALVRLSNAKLVSGNGVFLEAGSDRWGNSGRNGGHVTLQAEAQILQGDIVVNDISDISLALGRDTQLQGAINPKATAGKVSLELGDGAIWNVTGESSVDSLASAGHTLEDLRSKVISNGHVIHYRTKQGFLNGGKIPLDHGGMLVYTPAPKVTIPTNGNSNSRRNRGGNNGGDDGSHPAPPPGGFGNGRPAPPPGGFGGDRPAPPPDGFGGDRPAPPPDGFGGGKHGAPSSNQGF